MAQPSQGINKDAQKGGAALTVCAPCMPVTVSPLTMCRTLPIALVCLLLSLATIAGVGEALSRPATHPVGDAPADIRAFSVQIPISSTEFVSGWFSRSNPSCGVILLLHGIRSDRRQMLGRARFLERAGYSVLLIDLPAHGESSGERITFGAREAGGVVAALAYLRRECPAEGVGVIGVSLGAASLVLAKPSPPPSAVVLESMYPTITEAVADRLSMRFGPVGGKLAPLLVWQLPLRAGVRPEQLRPIAAISTLGAPVLIASGRKDQHTTWSETQRIFAEAEWPKELWAVEGAAHVDLYSYDETAYERRILKFFARYLRNEA